MSLKAVLSGLVGLIAGFALGVLVVSQSDQSSVGIESGHTQTYHSSGNESDEVGELQPISNTSGQPGQLSTEPQSSEMLSASLESLSGLSQTGDDGPLVVVPAALITALSESGQLRSLDQQLFPENGQLSAYLQLDELQVKRLETGWSDLREKVRKLETDTAQIEEKPDGTLEVVLPDLTASMDTLGNGFRATMTQAIGPNRAETLLAAAQINQVLGNLGSGRKLSIRAEETGDGGWRYHTVFETPDGKRTYVGENIPPSLQHLTGALEIAEFEEATE